MAVKLIKWIDKYIFGLACITLSPFSMRKRLMFNKLDKILIVKLWAVGESVLTLPMIKALREKYPRAEIDVLATPRNKDVYESCRYVNKVIVMPSVVLRKYDLVIDCEPWMNISAVLSFFAGKNRIGFSHGKRALVYNKRVHFNDKQHEVLTFLDLSKQVDAGTEPDKLVKLNVSKEDIKKVNAFLKKNKLNGFFVGIAPGVAESAKSRMWPLPRYAHLIDYIVLKMHGKVLLIGTEKDLPILSDLKELVDKKVQKNIVISAGELTLKQSFGLIGKCKIFVSNDTGPMHIAAAMGVPTLGLFGPNTPVRFAPYGKKNISIYHRKACSPCINVHKGQVRECKEGIDCMSDISAEEVIEAVEKLRKK
ncbi:MAG: glycosyltransferase family 9 protein [Nanoarchaeota archaeon]|nr:glycosyltransferase family 9 protein [Nanoarchaeota archaeon]